uniref:Uncharacterized protein n=1 Tax=Tetradesmus obliquus TaxID=3088 RepID=A0A383VIP8_TETOB|eukprot:jgi/Sobl393_1/803/SZX64544.1
MQAIHAAPVMPMLPAGGYNGTSDMPSKQSVTPAVTKPFTDCAKEIQEMLAVMLGIYTSRGHTQLSQTFDRFKFNCIFDLPLFFCRGADRMRVLSNLLALPFEKVQAEPKLVSVQMLNNRMGRIDMEATLHFYPRGRWLPFASLVIPESLPLHGTWTLVATGDDDKIMSVTETWHNVPGVPRLLRSLLTTAITTAGLAVNGW